MKQSPDIYVPTKKFKEAGDKMICGTAAESPKCKSLFWANVEYVSTGAVSLGGNRGWDYIRAMSIVHITEYKGELEPLGYHEHFREVSAGKRERCYAGMQIIADGRSAVIVGPEIKFRESKEGTQLTIF